MFNIIDEIYRRLASWDKAYADRWAEYMQIGFERGGDPATLVCRFWALELSLVDGTHGIREHLTPTNKPDVIVDIFDKEAMPLIRGNGRLFREQSSHWGYGA